MPAESLTESKPKSPSTLSNPPDNVRLALAALALAGPSNISAFTAAAGAVGARESTARAFSTQTLRRAMDPYIEAGWVLDVGRGFECAYGLGPKVLRSYSPQALAGIGELYKTSVRKSYYYESPERARAALEVDVKLALAGAPLDFCSPLDRLLEAFGTIDVVEALLRDPLHGAFDPEWFARFSPPEQLKLARPFLDWCETRGVVLEGFGEYARAANSVVQLDPDLRQTWARALLLLGGASALPAEVAGALPIAGGALFLRHVVAGDYAAARALLSRAAGSKRQPLLSGAAGLFQVLVLFRNETLGDREDAIRLANLGARKGNLFRESFSVLKRLLALQTGRKDSWFELLTQRPSSAADVLHELVQGLCVLWFKELELDLPYAWAAVQRAAVSLERQPVTWLSRQYGDLEQALEAAAPSEAIATLRRAGHATRRGVEADDSATRTSLSAADASRESSGASAISPLRQLFQQKPAWETALTRLEGLAQHADGSRDVAASLERVVWRVTANYVIEPYIQRATATGWSRGRRLAIKHLLPGASQRSTLPPEDLRVAEHARESVTQSYGYRETFHFFER
ncbi:MAG TPA: hypothetical protein VFQ35_25530, partial [Polyangiaceae bacterium]|nr:hypothetical protein [Polyangiaceae bacterium]